MWEGGNLDETVPLLLRSPLLVRSPLQLQVRGETSPMRRADHDFAGLPSDRLYVSPATILFVDVSLSIAGIVVMSGNALPLIPLRLTKLPLFLP